MSVDGDIAACAALVAAGDPPRFRATMAAPVAMRRLLFPLYAFNLEVARAPWVTSEPLIAMMRLQWWRDALDEIASGKKVRRHEVVTPLAAVLDAQAARELDTLIGAREADLDKDAPADLDVIRRYIDATAGTLLWTAARLSGATDEGIAREAGTAQGIAGLLSAVPDLVSRGHHPLPHGDPAQHAAELAKAGQAALTAFREARTSRMARPVFLVLPEAAAALKRIASDPEVILDPPPDHPTFKTRVSLGFRAAIGHP